MHMTVGRLGSEPQRSEAQLRLVRELLEKNRASTSSRAKRAESKIPVEVSSRRLDSPSRLRSDDKLRTAAKR